MKTPPVRHALVAAAAALVMALTACSNEPAGDAQGATPPAATDGSEETPAATTETTEPERDEDADPYEGYDQEPDWEHLGPVTVTNQDGHEASLEMKFLPFDITVDRTKGEPGTDEAGLSMVHDYYDGAPVFSLKNTGSQPYTAPRWGGLFSYYEVGSPACDAPDLGVTGPYMLATDDWCIYHLLVVGPDEETIEPGGIARLEQLSGATQSADLGHPETAYPSNDHALEIALSLSRPSGYLVRLADVDITGADCDDFDPGVELDPRYWGDEAAAPFAGFGPICG